MLKTTQLSAHAQNHASPERCRKSFTMIFLGDHDIPLPGSNFGNLAAFRAILAIFSLRMRRNGHLWTFIIVLLGLVFMGRHKCEAVACLSSHVKCNFYELLYCVLCLWRINLIWFDLMSIVAKRSPISATAELLYKRSPKNYEWLID